MSFLRVSFTVLNLPKTGLVYFPLKIPAIAESQLALSAGFAFAFPSSFETISNDESNSISVSLV